MASVEIRKVSITEVGTDAIVNAANEGLWAGGGVCGAIFQAAGMHELTKACSAIGHCATGSAVITSGFKLSRYIIHAVGPRWGYGAEHQLEEKQLYGCYQAALKLAVENGCRSVGFPLISSGIFGVPKDVAWKKALQACLDFKGDIRIVFAILDHSTMNMGKEMLEQMKAHMAASVTNKPVQKPSTHEERIQVFEDTMAWIQADAELAASVAAAKQNTQVFYEDDYPPFDMEAIRHQRISVTPERSFEAAMRLAKEHPGARIAVMNFANAFHAGGGVTKGAGAQEECLCRCSTLYPLLYRNYLRNTFYKHHHDLDTAKASDAMVYTEGVVICKTDDEHPKRMPKEAWVTVDVMTIAAPDLRTKSNPYAKIVGNGTFMNNAELFGYHVKRAIHMLTVAACKKADILVLGAFGCGAFENDPAVVARAYRTALQEFPQVFDEIDFAVYCKPGQMTNYETFRDVLA